MNKKIVQSITSSLVILMLVGIAVGYSYASTGFRAAWFATNDESFNTSNGLTLSGNINQGYPDDTRNSRAVNANGVFYIIEYQSTGDVTQYTNPGSAVVYYGKIISTGRSINAVGTVNANGADYAEYISYPYATTPGDIINVYNRYMVVSNNKTAAFVGGDSVTVNKTLVAFTGQVKTKVIGAVEEGDYIIPFGSGQITYGYAVKQPHLTLPLYIKSIGVAWENSTDPNIKFINVAVGIK